MSTQEIGTAIRHRRELLNITQEDLGEISGVTPRTIYQIETGKGNPSIETLKKILDVLGLEIHIQIKNLN